MQFKIAYSNYCIYYLFKVIKLGVLITKRVRWQEKQVFDSRSVGPCGWGWQTLAFVCLGRCIFVFNQAVVIFR